MKALVDRWRGGYDWRHAESLLNGWGQHKTTIDGLEISFLHVRSPEPTARPLPSPPAEGRVTGGSAPGGPERPGRPARTTAWGGPGLAGR